MHASLKRTISFSIAFLCIGLIWCVLLPLLAGTAQVRSRLDFLEENRIDPSAMYYTDLEIMDEILKKNKHCD